MRQSLTWKWRMSVHTSPRVSLELPSTRDSFCMFTSLIWRIRICNCQVCQPFSSKAFRPVLFPRLCHCPVADIMQTRRRKVWEILSYAWWCNAMIGRPTGDPYPIKNLTALLHYFKNQNIRKVASIQFVVRQTWRLINDTFVNCNSWVSSSVPTTRRHRMWRDLPDLLSLPFIYTHIYIQENKKH